MAAPYMEVSLARPGHGRKLSSCAHVAPVGVAVAYWLLVSETVAIRSFLWGLAFVCLAVAGGGQMAGHPRRRIVGWSGVAALCFLLGLFSGTLETWFGPRLTASLGDVASNFWVWLGVFAIVWLYSAITSIVLLVQRNRALDAIQDQILPIQRTLERFVLPRCLTPDQIQSIGLVLSAGRGFVVEFYFAENDDEAGEYMGDIRTAVEKGGWTVTAATAVPNLQRGLGVHFYKSKATQERPEDPRDPPPDALLNKAFAQAQVRVHRSGQSSTEQQDKLAIRVGSRFTGRNVN